MRPILATESKSTLTDRAAESPCRSDRATGNWKNFFPTFLSPKASRFWLSFWQKIFQQDWPDWVPFDGELGGNPRA